MYSEMVRVTVARLMALRRNQPMFCCSVGARVSLRLGMPDYERGEVEGTYDLQDFVEIIGEAFVLGNLSVGKV